MPATAAPNTTKKRSRDQDALPGEENIDIFHDTGDYDEILTTTTTTTTTNTKAEPASPPSNRQGGTSSNFRNVSACNRCRHRKNKCDQKLPRCSACDKADALCVGFDPVTKREIPRSYVYFLETRLRDLESLLLQHDIPVPPPEQSFPISSSIQPGVNVPFPSIDPDAKQSTTSSYTEHGMRTESAIDPSLHNYASTKSRHRATTVSKANNRAHLLPQQQDLKRSLPQTTMQPPGLSFSKVIFAAVRSSVPHSSHGSEQRSGNKSATTTEAHVHLAPKDCFFGLHTRPNLKPAPFPDRELGLHLVDLYFEHANPQIPILHRVEFMRLFDKVYGKPEGERTARESYLLKIVFAIGSGIIMDGSGTRKRRTSTAGGTADQSSSVDTASDDLVPKKRQRTVQPLAGGAIVDQHQPEEYHAAAVVHLENFLACAPAMDGHSGGVEELQAVLLLAALALLRPVAPGLWYIVGVAVRLAVDLGLHFEDIDPDLDTIEARGELVTLGSALGRNQWKRDLRRRLWWSVYSFDRLVSTCVGRPFGITDQVVTTSFPTLLPDEYVTKDGFTATPASITGPTYKLVTHHYLRLRLLQSEILQVLQYRQAQKARAMGANAGNLYMHTRLPSPFLHQFTSFREWRADVDRRLGEWKDNAPSREDIGVQFQPLFLELNYWQAIIMLYRQSLAVPAALAEELSASTGESVQSPGTVNQELEQDKQLVFLKVAQAGQMVIKTYRTLHRLKLVNYTFLATHHLFMSGVSFLYALWNSPRVRSQLTMDDVDFIILAATSVLTDLIDTCPPAEACRDAFTRMSKVTVAMCEKTTGFGKVTTLGSMPVETPGSVPVSPVAGINTEYFSPRSGTSQPAQLAGATSAAQRRAVPIFDMNLESLLGEGNSVAHRPAVEQSHTSSTIGGSVSPQQQPNLLSTSSPQASYHMSNTEPYTLLATSINQTQPELYFDDLNMLDTFPVGSQQPWFNDFGLDLSFGTGGTGYDNTNWSSGQSMPQSTGGLDLFEGFYFGNSNTFNANNNVDDGS